MKTWSEFWGSINPFIPTPVSTPLKVTNALVGNEKSSGRCDTIRQMARADNERSVPTRVPTRAAGVGTVPVSLGSSSSSISTELQ